MNSNSDTETAPDEEQHLLIIDGLNMVRRIHGSNRDPESAEKAQHTMRATLGSLKRALKEHPPTHVAALFDYGGHTWRHDLHADYRIGRKPMPEELRDVLPELKEHIENLGVPTLTVPGVEADDVFAALGLRWVGAKRGRVTGLTNDKDMTVLVARGIKIYDHFARVTRDEAWIQDYFGVRSELVHDLLALTGDASDDIPGVPGVAEKTAAKWLNAYGDLDGVIAAAETIKGKIGENLRASIELVQLSRRLVAFKTDMSLGVTWNSLRYSP